MMSISSGTRKFLWLGLLLVVAFGLVIVLTPVWLIQPFRPQTGRGVAVSYVMRSWSPILTIVLSILSLVIVFALWRGAKRWRSRTLLVLLVLPLLAATWVARQNHFEWMFHPLPNAAYAKVSEANFVANDDMLLAIENNGEAAAYPIRLMAYHHVVQDVVGGKPIVATY